MYNVYMYKYTFPCLKNRVLAIPGSIHLIVPEFRQFLKQGIDGAWRKTMGHLQDLSHCVWGNHHVFSESLN